MATNFRGYLDTLKKNHELTVISKATDLRDLAALVPQSDKALLFTNVRGYSMPVASGLLQSRNRLALGMGAAYEKIAAKLRTAMDHPSSQARCKSAGEGGDSTKEQSRSLPVAGSDIFRPHRRRDDDVRGRSGVRHERWYVPIDAQGEKYHRYRHRHAE
jgi:3-polyprenyl-4-hydroxybenzoate decarboxylase